MKKFDNMKSDELLRYVSQGTDDRIYAIAQLLRNGMDMGLIADATQIDLLFIEKLRNIVLEEEELRRHPWDMAVLADAKRMGFCDRAIADFWNTSELNVYKKRIAKGIMPVYKMIDT